MKGQMRQRKQKLKKEDNEFLLVGNVESEEKLENIVRMLPKFEASILEKRIQEQLVGVDDTRVANYIEALSNSVVDFIPSFN